jgi:hypothetical protein
VGVGLIVLGLLQLGVAVWWLVQSPSSGGRASLPVIGELILGMLALWAGVWKLRSRELD